MKKLFTLLLFVFSLATLSAQNLNFKDTNGLKTLLCSHTWYRYYVNLDSTFSNQILDSITFYNNGSFYKSASTMNPVDDADRTLPAEITTGKWYFGSTAKINRNDSATDCVFIEMHTPVRENKTILYWSFALVDWHRIKGNKFGKMCGNLDRPYMIYSFADGIDWDKREIWQPRREIKKAKKH